MLVRLHPPKSKSLKRVAGEMLQLFLHALECVSCRD